ncbi:MAG TPA: GNAT family protein [Burkholderiaceae bacterium]
MPLPLPLFDAFGLFLRPFRAGDEADWLAYLGNQDVVDLTGWQVSSVAELIALMQLDRQYGPIRFALARKTDDRLVGTFGFLDVDNGQAEIAYDLVPELWNKGIAGGAVACLCQWGIEVLALRNVKACTRVGNRASSRVLEKCGFRLEGTIRQVRYANGKPDNYRVYRWVAAAGSAGGHITAGETIDQQREAS